MGNLFDFSEEIQPTNGWIKFNQLYELEVYLNGEWIKLEEYEQIIEEKDGNL